MQCLIGLPFAIGSGMRYANPVPNLLAFAIIAGLGLYFSVPWAVYPLLAIGSVAEIIAGFAAYSRGRMFAHGRGEVVVGLCGFAAAGCAIGIGVLSGFWFGLASFLLFWPIMFRLGVKSLIGMPEPQVPIPQ